MSRKLIQNGCLHGDRKAFIQYLRDMGYRKSTLELYDWAIKCLDQFMHDHNQNQYSRDVGEAFLEDAARSTLYTLGVVKVLTYVIRRFNCFMEQGEYVLLMPRVSKETPPQFVEGFDKYIDHLRLLGRRARTIEKKYCFVQQTLIEFSKEGVQSYSDIQADVIYNAFERSNDKPCFCPHMREFLRFLFDAGLLDFDYSPIVPSVRKPHLIPSVYTKNEIESLLGAIDTKTESGSRNIAIILLALRLGMRPGDIARLKNTDVDFANKSIYFIQEKTQIPQRLELLPEIEKALLSYISMTRPASDIANIFLTLKPPIRPINARTIRAFTHRYFKKSGVEIGDRKSGAHSLRMTLASELAAEKVPYDAIRKILGHEDPVAIKHYVKFDIEALRTCSIEVPPVTGRLAAYMQARSGGNAQ